MGVEISGGNDVIFTSDGKKTLFHDIEGAIHIEKPTIRFYKSFAWKPKIFFTVAVVEMQYGDKLPELIN